MNETLLALRRINLNANTQANNPFWTPANTAIGIAQMRAFLAAKFPAYPDLSGLPFPQETILGVAPDYKIPYAANHVGRHHARHRRRAEPARRLRHTRTHDPSIGPDTNWTRNADGTLLTPGSALRQHHARRQRRIHRVQRPGDARSNCGPSANARAGLSYTLSKTTSNMSTGLSTGGVTNPFDLDEDLGPDDNDRRHNLVLDGSYLVPRIDVQAAGIISYRSALPYSVSTSFQLDSDPFSDRPEPRNSRRGDREKNFDLRFSKIFRFGAEVHGDGVLGDVQRVQRGQLAALPGRPAVLGVRPAVDRGTEAAPAARVPVRFLTRRAARSVRLSLGRRHGAKG